MIGEAGGDNVEVRKQAVENKVLGVWVQRDSRPCFYIPLSSSAVGRSTATFD